MTHELFTIGHSNHRLQRFLELLALHAIQLVCDVRSTPYSRFNPQYNRESLEATLRAHGIDYLYLGDALGGKPRTSGLPADDTARFALIAKSDRFRVGLERLRAVAEAVPTAIMCAEKDPAGCHRGLLICPSLPEEIRIHHILANGSLLDHRDLARDSHPGGARQPPLL
jgi:uncharacterized protein (DUF488 family)